MSLKLGSFLEQNLARGSNINIHGNRYKTDKKVDRNMCTLCFVVNVVMHRLMGRK